MSGFVVLMLNIFLLFGTYAINTDILPYMFLLFSNHLIMLNFLTESS